MNITRPDFSSAAQQLQFTDQQRDALWAALEAKAKAGSRFGLATVASYFGALLVISAMGWFMTLGWEQFGGLGICAIASTYALVFVLAGRHLWFAKGLRIQGGLLLTMAVCMTPLAVYGLEKALGFWPDGAASNYRSYHVIIKGTWIVMELSTIAAALIALRRFQFPFLVAPIAFTLWYMSMDLAPLMFGHSDDSVVSAVFGFVVVLVAFAVDRLAKQDFAFWLYLFGLMAFWGGLSSLGGHSELGKFIYALVNVGLIGVGVLLRRQTFAVFGALGIAGYLGHLAYSVFEHSMLFPFALSFIGLAVIFAGVQFQTRQAAIQVFFDRLVPAGLRALLPAVR